MKKHVKTGDVYGFITIVSDDIALVSKARAVMGRCICGTEKLFVISRMHSGGTKSCGCMKPYMIGNRSRKHGMTNSSIFHVWSSMKARCLNPNADAYPNYGGRGISVCERWMSFPAFLEDMGDRPAGMSIDRIDPNLGYYKQNCRWASSEQQSLNRRNTRFLSAFGETKPIKKWAEDPRCSIGSAGIKRRIKMGFSAELAISLPKTPRGVERIRGLRHLTAN